MRNIDKRIHRKAEALEIAKSLGYKNYTAAISGLYKSGKSFVDIGDIFKRSGAGIQLNLNMAGVELREFLYGYAYKDKQREYAKEYGFDSIKTAIVSMFNAGESPSQIALKFKITPQNIRYRLKLYGCTLKKQGGANRKIYLTEKMHKDIMESNDTLLVIADRNNMSATTVSKIKRGYTPSYDEA